MSHSSSLDASLEQRMRALETSVQRHRLAAVGAALLAVVGCFGGGTGAAADGSPVAAASVSGIVEADAFLLRDGQGGVAARLDIWNGGPRLLMYSAPEVEGVVLRTEPRSSELRLDAGGKRRAHLEANVDLNVGRFSLVEDSGKVMAQMLTEGGASNYALFGGANPKGVRSLLNLVMPPNGPPSILLRDSEQKARIIALDD